MNFSEKKPVFVILLAVWIGLLGAARLFSQDYFIYRPWLEKDPVSRNGRVTIHGEWFGQLQTPSTFPSFNDLSGPVDRWTYGFQNLIFLGEKTTFLAQLVTHDKGGVRTKFDWHFSFRYRPMDNLLIILGHDSNHDSENQSRLNGKDFYLNRNYVGFGIPFMAGTVYIEPFTWFFHHTNQRGHLDYSGEKIKQEYGVRVGTWIEERVGFQLQLLTQSESYFSLGQSILAEMIVRIKLLNYLHLSFGAHTWKDVQENRFGVKERFYKFTWGIAVPF